MKKSDFALISALYDSKRGGLYSDVYFPIIKYTIVSLFYQKGQQQYYTQNNVKEFILQNFGIEIPSLVLKKSIVAVSQKSSDLDLEVFENGGEFKILRAWDFSINEDIDAKAHVFDAHIDRLEEEYKKYVKAEGIESDKTFLDFISDNTDDILGYFENESVERIDTEYAVMAYFLKHLQKNSPELFKIASELFWGSIIAGFLKREKVTNYVSGSNVIEYYLDTPIVMGLLNLSTTENEIYSKELLDIIKASGGQPKIHPITMEEVKSIIASVENANQPIPNSPIEAAWLRDELSKSKLAQKRINAVSDLESMGAIHFPSFSQQNITKVKLEYTSKADVIALTQSRGGISYDRGIFRDIHDIYMDDYIEGRRKAKGLDDCCFFVTTNLDLINFCNERNKESRMRTIGSSKIILELWMHNTKQSGIESSALTEMMARCIDMNNRDVRNKLGIVSKYYNTSKRDDFDPKVFQEIIRCLYMRDKDVIAAVDGLKEGSDISVDVNLRILVEKAHNSSMKSTHQLSDMQCEIDDLKKRLDFVEHEKQSAIESGKVEETKKKELQEKLECSETTAVRQGELLELYEEKEKQIILRDNFKKELEIQESEKSIYIQKCDHYKFYYRLEVCLIIVFLLSLAFSVYQVISGDNFTISAVIAVLSLIITGLIALTRKSLYIIEGNALHDNMKLKFAKTWESMNPDYEQKKEELENVIRKISEIDDKIAEKRNRGVRQ